MELIFILTALAILAGILYAWMSGIEKRLKTLEDEVRQHIHGK